MVAFIKSLRGQNSLATLLKVNLSACVVICLLLEWWRPYFFLTDDNLSAGLPIFSEIGRHLKSGQTPFVSDYLFGGHYNLLRDAGFLIWHPFYLAASLLADTRAKFWMLDLPAFLFLLLTTSGFTILAHSLRREFQLETPDIYLVFYTLSYVFSNYVLTVGSSWVNMLGNQSALPWLVLGILDKKMFRGAFLVLLFTVHELLSGYLGLTVSTGLCLSVFAAGVALYRRSPAPLMAWYAGNVVAIFMLYPLLYQAMDGFADSVRVNGYTVAGTSAYNIPAHVFPFSFFAGHWNEPLLIWAGDKHLQSLEFPYAWSLLACGAAWCLVPAILGSAKWTPLEVLCLWLCMILGACIIRPDCISIAMHFIPIVRAMRWPFRESMQLLFFIHLLLVLRPQGRLAHVFPGIALWSLIVFLVPIPFLRVPTLNPLFMDRQMVLSGDGERFWNQVKAQLKPTDELATVIDYGMWQNEGGSIPYSLAGTANFPAYFQFICITGYSQTAPRDQIPLKTRPSLWFGAFKPSQMDAMWAERPQLKMILIQDAHPLKILLLSRDAPPMDLTPFLPKMPD